MSVDLQAEFVQRFGQPATFTLFSPGRVNLIGEHIDYCGGLVLPMAIDRGTRCFFSPNDIGRVRAFTHRFDKTAEFDISVPEKHGDWRDYVSGAIQALEGDLIGIDILVTDNIASGGLSSSASFTLAIATALEVARDNAPKTDEHRLNLARLCRRVENDFVGVPCGLMDQASVALGGVIRLDCTHERFTRLNADFGDYRVVVMDTSRPRTLAASKYAERVAEIVRICDLLDDGLDPASLCQQISIRDLPAKCKGLESRLARRLTHIITEQDRVHRACDAMTAGDMTELGKLMTESHISLQHNYEVTGDELDAIVEASWRQPGVLGARMTGAGFGGCAIALVHRDCVESHNRQVVADYDELTGLSAKAFMVGSSSMTWGASVP